MVRYLLIDAFNKAETACNGGRPDRGDSGPDDGSQPHHGA